MTHYEAPSNLGGERRSRLVRALESIVARRFAGENFSDDGAIAAYSDLMPEIGERLAALRLVERARAKVGPSSAGHCLPSDPANSVTVERGDRNDEPATESSLPDLAAYKIVGEIQRGGQGTVFEAVHKTTKRKVAIKLMHQGPFTTPREQARFEREIQILGQLQHPNIVAIHDSGTSAGRFYYVMDFVEGRALDSSSGAGRLSRLEVVRLFARICEAVNAAHLRGVIHRDLKPGNIRVDSQNEPHILDFGLAKVSSSVAHSSVAAGLDASPQGMTHTGQFVGSLPWASPEQLSGSPEQLDVRSDVYSLGVIFYQLLTDAFPYDVVGPMRDVIDNVLRGEPRKPSRIRAGIDDEIEAIVLKCLRKDPQRRYQSAGEIARDIHRYLAGEPIEAKREAPQAHWYLFRKFVGRHRAAATVSALFLLVLAGSAFAMTILFRQAQYQAGVAAEQRDAAQKASQTAEERRIAAEQETRKSAAIQAFLQDMLASVDPEQAPNREVTVRQILDEASQRVGRELAAQPAVAAAVNETIGITYSKLGRFGQAEEHLRSALETRESQSGAESVDVAASLTDLGGLLQEKGDLDEAATLLERALTIREKLLGRKHRDTAQTLSSIADVLGRQGKNAEAEALHREALAIRRELLGEENREVGSSLNNLAGILMAEGKFDEADEIYTQALAISRRVVGEDHLDTASILNNLGGLRMQRGDYAGAERTLREALPIFQSRLGMEHPNVATVINNLAQSLHERGDYAGAEPFYRQALDLQRKLLGNDHPNVAACLNNLAELLRDKGDYPEAEQAYREALQILKKSLGEQHGHVATLKTNLAHVLFARGDLDASEALYREALDTRRKLLGERHVYIAQSLHAIAGVLAAREEYDRADPVYRSAAEMLRGITGPRSPMLAVVLNDWGKTLVARGEFKMAEPLIVEALGIRRATLGESHPDTILSVSNLATARHGQGDVEQAETMFRDALSRARSILPDESWQLAAIRVSFGTCLSRSGKFTDAEELLLRGYEQIDAVFGPQSKRTLDVARKLGEMYAAWGKAELAAQWRSLLPESNAVP